MQRTLFYLIISMTVAIAAWSLPCFAKAGQPAAGVVMDENTAEPFTLVALIMELHTEERLPYIVVAEKSIRITSYTISGTQSHTKMTNRNDSEIQIPDLKVGQRVIIHGWALPDGTLVGETIQVKPK